MKTEIIENEMETETEETGNSDGGGSRKRPLETGSNEDDSTGCVTKKSNLAEINSEESINVKMMIPAFATGALIGKNGETIATVQKETNCRIKMSKNNDVFPNTNERLALVTGTPSAILKVVAFIAEKTKDKFDSSFKNDAFDYKSTERWREIKIVIPSSCAGMVIGKGGEYIKSIKDQTGAFVQISAKDLVETRLLERVVTIVGRDLDEIVDGARMVIAKLALDTNHSSTLYTNVSYFHITSAQSNSAQGANSAPANRPPSPGGGGYLGAAPFQAPPSFSAGPPAPFLNQNRSYSPSHAYQNQTRRYQSPPPPAVNGAAFLGGPQALGSSPGTFSGSHWLQNPNNNNNNPNSAPLASMSFSSTSSSSTNSMNNLGNLQVLQFLEGLRSTLRSNGYNETAVAEIMQAMQMLAKYNVLGLGLGFGLSAISKMTQQPSNPAPLTDPDIGHHGHGSLPSGLNPMAFGFKPLDVYPGQQTASPTTPQTGIGGGGTGRYSSNIGFAGFDSPMVDVGGGNSGDSYLYRNRSDQRSFSSSGAGGGYLTGKSDSHDSSVGYISRSTMRFDQSPRSPGQADYASSVLKEYCSEHNKLELTVPEAIIGAVLGKQGKNLSDIQHYSGAKVEVSKRGQLISGTQDRMISIEGSPESIRIARAKIEKSINEEQQKRSGRNRF